MLGTYAWGVLPTLATGLVQGLVHRVARVRTGHLSLAAAYLHISGAGTRPSAHTVKAPKKQSSIWCSNVRPTIKPGGTRGQETSLQQNCDASGATWNGSGWWPPPLTGNERDIGVCSPGLTDSNSHVHSMLLLTPVSSEPMLTFYAHSYCLILYGRWHYIVSWWVCCENIYHLNFEYKLNWFIA